VTGKIYYGWWVLAAAFAGEMFAIGSTTYAFGLFVKPLAEAFATDRATINIGLMLFIVGMGLSGPLVGRLLDRFPARHVMAAGAGVMGAGMVAVAAAPTLGVMGLAVLLLVAVGATMIGPLAANTLGARWFARRRGLALGIIAVGTSVGGTVFVPMMGYTMAEFGWRGALVVQGIAIALVYGAIAALVVRSRPEEHGLHPDGAAAPLSGPAGGDGRVWTAGQTLARRDFWCIALAVALTFSVTQATLISLVPFATDIGYSDSQAQWLVSFLAACTIFGKLGIGALADRFDKRWLLLVVIAAVAVEQLVFLMRPGYGTLMAVCGLAGFASGGTLPLWASLIGERFGARSFASVMGLMNPVNMVFSLVTVPFIGRVFDKTGNYDLAFQTFIGAAIIAAVLTVLITPREKA
jgi:MFS family permease